MAIIMNQAEQVFTLQTKRTTYQMKAGDYGILLHLYYGARVEDCTMDYLLHRKDVGFSGNPYEAGEDRTFSLDTLPHSSGLFLVYDLLGLTHKNAYRHSFATSVVIPLFVTIVATTICVATGI